MKLDKIAFAHVVAHCVSNGMAAGEYEVTTLDRLIDFEVPVVEAAKPVYPKNEDVEALLKHMAGGTNKLDAIRNYRAITGMGLKDSKDAVERYWPSIKPNSYTYSELKAKLNETSYNADEEAAIMHFLDKL